MTALARQAVAAWLLSPVTSLVVRWLMPDVGRLMDDLTANRLDETCGPPPRPVEDEMSTGQAFLDRYYRPELISRGE